MKIFDYNSYHFIGIGGIGISAIARMLQGQGKRVTGSDSASSEITDDLEKIGIKVFIGQKSDNIKPDIEVVIYTIAIPDNNPELIEARNRNLICVSYPEALGELSKNMFTIAVSGTHGKTTTTAMIGHILKEAGEDPTIIVGSKILGENTNFLAGKGKYLVVEACEYKRSFLNLHPKILVITNIDSDHLDYYKGIEDIQSAFHQMALQVEEGGNIVTDQNNINIKISLKDIVAKISDYKSIRSEIDLSIPGKHNVENAKAAIQVAKLIGIDEDVAHEALKKFKGTWRRLEYKGERNGNFYFDDYAHHPTEIKATLNALREKYPDRELVCLFEPHQQSRTRMLFDDFVESLKIADKVFITPIFVTREIRDDSISNKTLSEAVNKFTPSFAVTNPQDFITKLESVPSSKNRSIVLMGAGNIYKWTDKIMG